MEGVLRATEGGFRVVGSLLEMTIKYLKEKTGLCVLVGGC